MPAGQYREGMNEILTDLLKPGLQVVFCGVAASTASARARAYYAGPGNAFWRTLFATGLTPRQLAPSEYERLLGYGFGLTDLCKTRHGSDQDVGTEEFDVDGLRARIVAVEPGYLAFNGKNAAQGTLEREVTIGLQEEQIGGATVWVLPSTSAAARRYWDIGPWEELARVCTGTK
jgi:double-stranded uracil-DNA glycosylase